jgi:hypothetical protein
MGGRASRWGALLVLICGAISGPPPARAEKPPEDGAAAETEIEPIVQRGIELRRVGLDSEALATFREALARAPRSVRVKVHLAATHQALGQWLEAEQYLRDVLRDDTDPYIQRHRATLEKAYEFVDRRLGSLDVVGGPAGAELLLSGRRVGQLPLASPARVPVGSYVLEVRKEGYYAVTRPISIGAGTLLRESVELGRRETATPALRVASATEPGSIEDRTGGGSPRWLTWTLLGGGIAAGTASAIAFSIREEHASNWNSDACLMPGYTRGELCPSELEEGRTAERWAIGTAIVSGVLFGGALTSFLLERPAPDEAAALTLEGCRVGASGAQCFGSF